MCINSNSDPFLYDNSRTIQMIFQAILENKRNENIIKLVSLELLDCCNALFPTINFIFWTA